MLQRWSRIRVFDRLTSRELGRQTYAGGFVVSVGAHCTCCEVKRRCFFVRSSATRVTVVRGSSCELVTDMHFPSFLLRGACSRRRSFLVLALLATVMIATPAVFASSVVGNIAKAPLTFLRVSFTTSKCTRILTAMRLTALPNFELAKSESTSSLSGSAITLNTPTNDKPCAWGKLSFTLDGIPSEITSRVTPYTLFLRVVKDILPVENYLFGVGRAGSCPTSPMSSPSNITLTSLLFFTPENNKTKISTWASNIGPGSDVDTNKLLAHGVLYATVVFDLSGATKEEIEEITEGDSGIEVSEFHCFLANNAEAANEAVDDGQDGVVSDQANNRDSTPSGSRGGSNSRNEDKRKFTTGEIVGIAGGTIVALVTIVTIILARSKRSRPVDAPRLPRGL